MPLWLRARAEPIAEKSQDRRSSVPNLLSQENPRHASS
jgi:hypothetical protein